jgi:imidazolonepropionase
MDLIIKGARLYSPGLNMPEGDCLAVSEGEIAFIGPYKDCPFEGETLDAEGRWLTPGLIDCHTHLVFGGSRSEEFEKRLQGVSYAQIASEGGGILSTVAATRRATEAALLASAQARADILVSQGVTSLDVKSGYGLDLDSELKMLKVAGRLIGPRITRGFLGAHTVPAEYRPDSEAYLNHLVEVILPAAEPHCDYIDAFCETVAFSPDQVRRLFRTTSKPKRLHADQLTDGGGGALAPEFKALSADHLEYSSRESLQAMKEADTVAVLLPGAYFALREPQAPDVATMREIGLKMAVATDLNPGTSPFASLPFAMLLACVEFGLTSQEAWEGVTIHAAAALGRPELGQLRVGAPADLALWNFAHPRDLTASLGMPYLAQSWVGGQPLYSG